MKSVSTNNFGLLIAYLLPGFTCLWGLSYVSQTVRSWLGVTPLTAPTVSGFLYVTLASVAAGLTASTLRWLVIDTIHHWTGVPSPQWDFSRLQRNVEAYNVLIEIHYRYAQFYGGEFLSLVFAYVMRRISLGFSSAAVGWTEVWFFCLAVIFFAGSRDSYRKYMLRGNMLLGQQTQPPRGAHEEPEQAPVAKPEERPPLCSESNDSKQEACNPPNESVQCEVKMT
jgi:hypothetical protein